MFSITVAAVHARSRANVADDLAAVRARDAELAAAHQRSRGSQSSS